MTKVTVCETLSCVFVPGYIEKYASKIRKDGDDSHLMETFDQLKTARNRFLGAAAIAMVCGVGFLTSRNWPLGIRLLFVGGALGEVYLTVKRVTTLWNGSVSFHRSMNADKEQEDPTNQV